MLQVLDPFRFVLIAVAGWMHQREDQIIDYLREENRVVSPALKVKSLPAERLLASHRAVPVRLDRTAATGLIWFWTLLEAGNGIGHLTLAATRGGYFPVRRQRRCFSYSPDGSSFCSLAETDSHHADCPGRVYAGR